MYVYQPELQLTDVSVLILETETSVASDLTYAIAKAGGDVIGPASSVADAELLLKDDMIDVVVLGDFPTSFKDINFAHGLEDKRIPFLFHVNTYSTAWNVIFPEAVVVQKGTSHSRIVSQLARLVSEKALPGEIAAAFEPTHNVSGYSEHFHMGSMIQ